MAVEAKAAAKAELQLFSAWFCPFAQRAWIALEEKGVQFELVEIDPYDKTQEFLAVNPRGLVPALRHNGRCVYESMVVMEYVDEAFPATAAAAATGGGGEEGLRRPLMPSDPYERAVVRIWMDFVNRKVVPTFYRYLQRQDKAEQEKEREALVAAYAELGEAMLTHGSDGPFFLGPRFSAMDISLIPWLVRHDVLAHFRGFELPRTSAALQRFHVWAEACEKRPSVMATLADKEKLRRSYDRYADNTATSQVALAVNTNKPLP